MAESGKKKSLLAPEDIALFHEAVGTVEPVANAAIVIEQPPKTRRRTIAPERLSDFIDQDLSDGFALAEPIEHGGTLSYLRPDSPPPLLKKLRRGQFSVSANLDLHGMSIDEARNNIARFFTEQRRAVRCCVRIVHGKGNRSIGQIPVLKRMVNHWLPQRDDVIAFCSTPAHDGGTGAIYVLLRKSS